MNVGFGLIAVGGGVVAHLMVRYLLRKQVLRRLKPRSTDRPEIGRRWHSASRWLQPPSVVEQWARLADSAPDWRQQWLRNKVGATALASALAVFLGNFAGASVSKTVVGLAIGVAFGRWWPTYRLRTEAMRRQSALRKQLPALLERYLLGAAAGLSVRQSLRLAAERTSGPLGVVTDRIVQRLDVGIDLEEAVRNELAKVEAGPVRLVLSALIRSERLGMPIAVIAEEQSRFVRQLSALEVERAVDALPLKLTICGIFFLFPPVFVVALVPNLLSFLSGQW